MSDLASVFQVVIDRQAASVAQTTFGTPGIIAEFDASVTTVDFTRARTYASTSEMTTDAVPQNIIDAAAKVFEQNPHPAYVQVGRLDAGDATIAAGLDAIQLETPDWYTLKVLGLKSGVITLSTDLIADNVIHSTINGVAVADVTYATSHADTMTAWETAIETALGALCTATSVGDVMTVVITGVDVVSMSVSVTGGVSQPTVATVFAIDETNLLAAAAWAESQMKIMTFDDSDVDILSGASTSDLFYQLQALNRARTVGVYKADPSQYFDMSWVGKVLPDEPGSVAWAWKEMSGVTADVLTSSQVSAILAKDGNVYDSMAGRSVTRNGFTFSGERIEVIVGVDWITATLQERIFALLVNNKKVSMDDFGLLSLYNVMAGVLGEAEARGILVPGYTVINVPKYKDLTAEQKLAGILPGTFSGKLSLSVLGATISGRVTA